MHKCNAFFTNGFLFKRVHDQIIPKTATYEKWK